jgi:hypothetical protein
MVLGNEQLNAYWEADPTHKEKYSPFEVESLSPEPLPKRYAGTSMRNTSRRDTSSTPLRRIL